MKTLELSGASDAGIGMSLCQFIEEKKSAPWIITSGGKTVAALTHLNEDDLEDFLVGNNPRFAAIIQRSRAQIKNGDFISLDEYLAKRNGPKSRRLSAKKKPAKGRSKAIQKR